jgi:hypothetical protein
MSVPKLRITMTPSLLRLVGGALSLSLLAATTLPAAAENDDLTFEQRVIQKLLGGGDGAGIDYRERAPLVIPPNENLPPPESSAAVVNSPAWPKDPDKVHGRESGGPMSADYNERESARVLNRKELNRGRIARGSRSNEPVVTLGDAQMGRPLRPSELGETHSLFGLMNIGGRSKPATFTGEPPRTSLIEPPPGYQTPASTQPYAPPSDSRPWYKKFNFFDRGIDNDH